MPEKVKEEMDKELQEAIQTVEKIGILKKALEERTKEIVAEALRELLKSDEFIELVRAVIKDEVREAARKLPPPTRNPWDDERPPEPKRWRAFVDKFTRAL